MTTSNELVPLLHAFCIILASLFIGLQSSSIKINEYGQYSDILVAIDENIPENDQLLKNLKAEFKKVSNDLQKATKRTYSSGVSFKTVKILIPKSWKETKSQLVASWESYERADLRINHATDEIMPPSTKQTGGCGDQGSFITFTDYHFLNLNKFKDRYGRLDKSILHEWSKYRWGLFSEYPSDNYPNMYLQGNIIEPVRCTLQINGYVMNTATSGECQVDSNNNIEKDCSFYPQNSETKTKASILSYNYLDSIETFCDDGEQSDVVHNSDAINQHNDLCDKMSAWAVMRRHSDFSKNYTNSGENEPEFITVQVQNRSVVLVLDVSGSMADLKLKVLKSASKIFIRHILEPSASLGMIKFSGSVDVLETLKTLTEEDKINYIDKLNSLNAAGSTHLGDALAKGFEILGGNMSDPKNYDGNGYIMIISDGEESGHSLFNFSEAIDIVTKSKVKVDSISIGDETDDRLKNLASKTGGKYLLASPSLSSTDLLQAMIDTLGNRVQNQDKIFVVDSGSLVIGEDPQPIGNIDRDSGRDTIFVFKFANQGYQVTVISPDQRRFNSSDGQTIYQEDSNGLTITVTIPNIAEAGNWFAIVSKKISSFSQDGESSANYLTMTKSRSDIQSSTQIEARSNCSNIQDAEIKTRCKYFIILEELGGPVLNADVNLIVTRPNQTAQSIKIFDFGSGTDSKAYDGIYSGSVIGRDLTLKGMYNLRANIQFFSKLTNSTISRVVTMDALNVLQALPENAVDNFPPDKIRNVSGIIDDKKTRTIEISFRAVGNDGDRYTAAKYEFKLNDEPIDIKAPSPQPPNQIEIIKLPITTSYTHNNSFILYVRAVDEAGNRGSWSQGLPITFDKPVFGVPNKSKIAPSISTEAVVGIVVFGIVFMVVVISAFIYFRSHKETYEDMSMNSIYSQP